MTPITKFFQNYPGEELYFNDEELKQRLGAMRDACIECRQLAVRNTSITGLRDAQTLDMELGLLQIAINQRRSQRDAIRI